LAHGKGKATWKNQFFLYENASDFHNLLREIFCTDTYFKQIQCFQEVPMINLVDDYDSNFEAVDWYIEPYNLVIELHGNQHYKPTSFGNMSYNQKIVSFNNIRYRDNKKKTALLESGYNYLEIPYKLKDKLNADFLKQLIYESINTNE
jgi:hypothetical protein